MGRTTRLHRTVPKSQFHQQSLQSTKLNELWAVVPRSFAHPASGSSHGALAAADGHPSRHPSHHANSSRASSAMSLVTSVRSHWELLTFVRMINQGIAGAADLAVAAIADLALVSDAQREQIVAAGALPALVYVLGRHAYSNIKERAAMALARLADGGGEGVVDAIAAAGATPVLVKLLKCQETQLLFGVTRWATTALGALARYGTDAVREDILEEGAIPVLCRLLRHKSPDVSQAAARALAPFTAMPSAAALLPPPRTTYGRISPPRTSCGLVPPRTAGGGSVLPPLTPQTASALPHLHSGTWAHQAGRLSSLRQTWPSPAAAAKLRTPATPFLSLSLTSPLPTLSEVRSFAEVPPSPLREQASPRWRTPVRSPVPPLSVSGIGIR